MAVDRAALALAVAECLETGVANRLHDAWSVVGSPAEPDETDAAGGIALTVAMLGGSAAETLPQVQALTLYQITLPEAGVVLSPREAYSHPLVSPWLCATFTDLIGEVIGAGRTASNIGISAPIYDSLTITSQNGAPVEALARLIFQARDGAVTVDLRFGRPAGQRFVNVTAISGDALFAVGMALRSQPPRPPQFPTEPTRTAPDGGAIH